MFDMIIIGAGPAGLSTALYALRANKKVLILEASAYGGQIINASNIENYPGIKSISGFDFATNLYNQVKDLGATIKFEKVLKVTENKKVTTIENTYQAKVIVIATGKKPRKLEIEGEDKLIGKGISYCATCDGNFYKGKEVAIVGGGNTAIEDAIYLSAICKKVHLIHRREEFRAFSKSIEELKSKENVEFILNSNIAKINGNDYLESIEIKKDNEIINLKVQGLFIAIGGETQNEIFTNVVDLDEFGYIETHNDVMTKTSGIFVAGDARNKGLYQLTTAVADGALAADLAIKYINLSTQ